MPQISERTAYVPTGPAEQFIVPMLAEAIERVVRSACSTPNRGALAVDIGCGGQPFRRLLEEMRYNYLGVDPRPTAGVTVDYAWPIDGLEIPAGLLETPCTLILCTEVLEHVPDWAAAFHNLSLLSPPLGRVLITCPAFYVLHEEPWDYWRPTDHALRHFAARYGFSVIHSERLGDASDVLGTLLGGASFHAADRRISTRILARIAEAGRQSVLRGLERHGALRLRLRLRGGVYLANIMVLERTDADVSDGHAT